MNASTESLATLEAAAPKGGSMDGSMLRTQTLDRPTYAAPVAVNAPSPVSRILSGLQKRFDQIRGMFDSRDTVSRDLEAARRALLENPSADSLRSVVESIQRLRDLEAALPDEELAVAEAREQILGSRESWTALADALDARAEEFSGERPALYEAFAAAVYELACREDGVLSLTPGGLVVAMAQDGSREGAKVVRAHGKYERCVGSYTAIFQKASRARQIAAGVARHPDETFEDYLPFLEIAIPRA